jgi:hypothetical protein
MCHTQLMAFRTPLSVALTWACGAGHVLGQLSDSSHSRDSDNPQLQGIYVTPINIEVLGIKP